MKEKNKIPGTLQGQAWKRAVENKKPNAGTPHDWEDYEKKVEKTLYKDKGATHSGSVFLMRPAQTGL